MAGKNLQKTLADLGGFNGEVRRPEEDSNLSGIAGVMGEISEQIDNRREDDFNQRRKNGFVTLIKASLMVSGNYLIYEKDNENGMGRVILLSPSRDDEMPVTAYVKILPDENDESLVNRLHSEYLRAYELRVPRDFRAGVVARAFTKRDQGQSQVPQDFHAVISNGRRR